MQFSNFLYRQKQKWKYHTAGTLLEKNVAEINRNEPIVRLGDDTFTIKGCELNFNQKDHAFIVEGIELVFVLLKGGDFSIRGRDLFYRIDGLTLAVTTAEEIFIIHEIFFEGCYAVSAKGEYNVIDIGVNVGYASLFFARHDNIKKVYGFEPFKPTYEQAQFNFQNNKVIAAKIECFSYGLSNREEHLEVDYSYNGKGQVGIYGTTLIKERVHQSGKIKIELFSAGDELKKIFDHNKGERFVLKIDCEGAEYGIFESLDEHKLFDNVDIIIIEWHEAGPEVLLDILLKNNFKAFYHQASTKKVGMIYAAR